MLNMFVKPSPDHTGGMSRNCPLGYGQRYPVSPT